MQMTHWLVKRAQLTPHRTAVICGDEQLTFAELKVRACKTAERLMSAGVHRGDVVGLLCRNGLHVVELVHAIHLVGAVLMPLNTRLTAHEIGYQLHDVNSSVLITDDANRQLAEQMLGELPELSILSAEELTKPLHERLDNDTALDSIELATEIKMDAVNTIMYTSGTTGAPKGVILTYGNHWASAVGSALNLGIDANDRWLAAVPLFHISGLSILMRSVIYGMSIIIHEKFDAGAANRAIIDHGVTIVSVVSNMLTRMLDDLGEERYPEHFRCMLLGGGPAPLPLLEACVAKDIPVFQTYGMTETASQIVTLPPEFMLTKLGSAGKPLFQSEVRIVREDRSAEQHDASEARLGDLELAQPKEPGEIQVRGPNVTSGYWKRPEATADAIREGGWLATGDIGYLDEDGFLYVLDRRKDLIVSGGENVYPAEIESVLVGHPSVEEAGVTGVSDEQWGQVPIAIVKLRDGAEVSEIELLDYCSTKLAKYKLPSRIYFVDRLPRNAANKLLRRELLSLLPGNNAGREYGIGG